MRAPWSMYGKVYVLRLGHRPERDKRITTHVALVARAFGANGFVLAGLCDDNVRQNIRWITEHWGGRLEFECGVNPREYVRRWKEAGGEVVHLTMYGIPVDEIIGTIRSSPRSKLIVVGAEKVEGFYYDNADYNVSITTQPHSEVAALAVFLDRLYNAREMYMDYPGAKWKVVPQRRGKRVERTC